MHNDERLKSLPFDLFERYVLLQHIGEFFRPEASAFHVLDVGGDTPAFWPGFPSMAGAVIPGANPVVVDVHPHSRLRNYVRASGFHLPFGDGSFDLVCSLDTLEHLPAHQRVPFLAELLRVTRDGLYLAFPYDSPANLWAENILLEFADVVLHDPIQNLLEHREFGLPDREAVSDFLAGASCPLIRFDQGNTDVWLLMMLTYHSLRLPGTDFVHQFDERFNRAYAAQDWAPPTYRAGFVLSKQKSREALEALRRSFQGPGPAGRVELNAVLSLCQLFLQIAHQGRVVVDKDRHIRNIESDLAAIRSHQAQWEQLTAALRQLEAGILQQPGPVAGADTPDDWPPERVSRLLDAAGRLTAQAAAAERLREMEQAHAAVAARQQHLQALVQDFERESQEKDARLNALEFQIQEQERQSQQRLDQISSDLQAAARRLHEELQAKDALITDLALRLKRLDESARASVQSVQEQVGQASAAQERSIIHLQGGLSQLTTALNRLQADLTETHRQVRSLYESRIWKTLQRAASLLQRMFARGKSASLVEAVPAERLPAPSSALPQPPAPETVRLVCDFPAENQELPGGVPVPVRGWAAAETQIEKVEITIDGQTFRAEYGLPRPDVMQQGPRVPGAGQSGFLSRQVVSQDGFGPRQIVITAVSNGGAVAEIRRTVNVAPRRGEPLLVCDRPGTNGLTPVRGLVEVSGWALDQFGIEQIEVRVDDRPATAAEYGLLRLDVGRDHPDFSNADRSGYRYLWETSHLREGTYSLLVRATALDGAVAECRCQVLVDPLWTHEYTRWIALHEPDPAGLKRLAVDAFPVQPLISIAVPVFKTPLRVLRQCIDSVVAQTYANWELCLADDGSQVPALTSLLEQYAAGDPRIRFVTLPRNKGISGATNAALKLARGDYFAFLDHDDELAPFALHEVVQAVNASPETDLFYSDEDKISHDLRRYEPFFKPGWSPDLFLSCNYLCHFIVGKRWLLDAVGGLDETCRHGSQDYDFLLRVTEHTQKIRRIPRVLYHWRAMAGSTAQAGSEKPKASEEGRQALARHLAKTAPGVQVEECQPCRYRIRYPVDTRQKVTIIMPSGGNLNYLRPALEDVLSKTSYPAFEVLVVDNSKSGRVKSLIDEWKTRDSRLAWLDRRNQPFNFSRLNNEAVARTDSPLVLFLNDDMTVIHKDWLTAMVEHAQRKEVGAVGALLLYPDGRIQHAGVTMGIYENSGHLFKGLPPQPGMHFDLPLLVRNCSSVTAACLLTRRDVFLEAGGFDEENLAVAFQDVDFCLKVHQRGYRVVYTPFARLYHHESVTKDEKIPNPKEVAFMQEKWCSYIEDDPYYNPNLTRKDEHYNLRLE